MYNVVQVNALAESWKTGNAAAIEKVDKQLAASGLTNDAIVAETLSCKLQEVERIDRMAMTAEARRNGALREIELHRENLAQKLRKATQVEDAEYSIVPDHKSINNNAAA